MFLTRVHRLEPRIAARMLRGQSRLAETAGLGPVVVGSVDGKGLAAGMSLRARLPRLRGDFLWCRPVGLPPLWSSSELAGAFWTGSSRLAPSCPGTADSTLSSSLLRNQGSRLLGGELLSGKGVSTSA